MTCFWIFLRKNLALISLITILLGWGFLNDFFQLSLSRKESTHRENDTILAKKPSEKLPVGFLSYNVRLFNYYNWLEDTEARDKIFSLISEKEPAILCLQEIYSTESGSIPQLSIDSSQANSRFSHFAYTTGKILKGKYGIATFTAFPIINRGEIRFSGTTNLSIYTDIVVYSDTIRIFNNHLQSIRLKKKNYDFIEMLNPGNEEEAMDEILDISSRLKYAFIKRAQQADILSRNILNSPYPVIVCGDFNDTPVSYTYRKIRGKLKDAFIESGRGFGNTYWGKFPSYRIDYILYSKDITSAKFETIKVNYSDHFPVSCTFGF